MLGISEHEQMVLCCYTPASVLAIRQTTSNYKEVLCTYYVCMHAVHTNIRVYVRVRVHYRDMRVFVSFIQTKGYEWKMAISQDDIMVLG